MSTKIYNGFKLETGKLSDVLELVQSFRPFVVNVAEQMLDNYIEAGGTHDAFREAQRKIKNTELRNPAFDTDFQIVIFPDGERMLGIVYCEHAEWRNQWMELPGVQYYGYWNNTDPQEGVSDDEWKARRDAWDRVLQGYLPPGMQGFSIQVSDPNGPAPKAWR